MIRRAKENDIERIIHLLYQVHKVHADGRPDIFIQGQKKYNEEDLVAIIKDDERPIFVYTETEDGPVLGYAFCIYDITEGNHSMRPRRVLYIDDICVDEMQRRKGIAAALYDHVVEYAKEQKFDSITLNVWELNKDAAAFYQSRGMKPLKTVMETIL